ncbi:MAG: DUF2807 domain-containing protein [Bacteroidales bacterium]|nr:DUF2807 domain-containing protein [Bacteroidales bacterium]
MKTLCNKILTLVICMTALAWALPSAKAQSISTLEEKVLPVGEFSSVKVTDDFNVSLVKGSYSVRLTTDKALAPYVQVYVRSKVLYITYDSKSVPKDLKKQYKGKGVPEPVFRAVVYLPELNGITLEDNATLIAVDEFRGGTFTMNLQDKSQVKGLKLRAGSAQISLKRNSQANIDLSLDQKADVSTDGNATLVMNLYAPEVSVATAGSSSVSLSGESQKMNLSAAGSSKVSANEKNEVAVLSLGNSSKTVLTGTAETIQLNSEKNAELDAANYAGQKLEANMNSGRATVNVEKELSVNLSGGSALYYSGTPVFKIGKILKSTLAPSDSAK